MGYALAVTGFDGVQSTLYSQPPLTTVDKPIAEITHRLVHMLLAEINGETLPERDMLIQQIPRYRRSTHKGGHE